MKSFRSKFELVSLVVITLTGLFHLAELADVVSGYQKCYNTTEDTHCFDVLYDNTTNKWLTTSFDIARQRCNDIGSTLLIIKDEATNGVFQQFMSDTNNPIRMQSVWTDAYRFNDFNVTYPWQWLNKSLSNLSASDVDKSDYTWYMAALGFSGRSFYLKGQQPHFNNSYICEYSVSNCSSISTNNIGIRQLDGRCYAAINAAINWYEARNRCLRDGGDLASFANVTSINFTSWFGSDSNVLFWIGLRFARYTWIDSGEDVTFSKWLFNYYDWTSPCLVVCFAPICNSNFSWFPTDCSAADTIKVVCHTATTLHPTTTTSTSTSTTSPTVTTQSNNSLTSDKSSGESAPSNRLAIPIGVGVGVGVPVVIAIIVIIVVCIVVRRRRNKNASSVPSANRRQNESSFDKPTSASTVNKNDIEQSTYGTVVPSTSSREAAKENNSAKEQTVYAPLQIL